MMHCSTYFDIVRAFVAVSCGTYTWHIKFKLFICLQKCYYLDLYKVIEHFNRLIRLLHASRTNERLEFASYVKAAYALDIGY